MVDVPWLGPCVIGTRIGVGGYARLPSGRRGVYLYAHRVAWEAAHGPIPDGMHVHHKCRNPGCVNVDHLELHSPREHRKRHRRCDHGDEHRYVKPDGHTRCRICYREYNRKRGEVLSHG
jgi:hypothetical protein